MSKRNKIGKKKQSRGSYSRRNKSPHTYHDVPLHRSGEGVATSGINVRAFNKRRGVNG